MSKGEKTGFWINFVTTVVGLLANSASLFGKGKKSNKEKKV
jgi:hypothetical protein